jgi:hypothetical protein
MSADVCQKHQHTATQEDPCLYCTLEIIKRVSSQDKKRTELSAKNIALDTIFQICKDLLARRKVTLKR